MHEPHYDFAPLQLLTVVFDGKRFKGEILRVADEHEAAVIVVGTHHHSALSRLFGEDVAATVTRRAHCDVVVAR